MRISRRKFYALSFTWGLPLSLIGIAVCVTLMLLGYRPKRYGHCYYIALGNRWGGLEFGWFFLTDTQESDYIKNHELGHGYQNIKYGAVTCVLWIIAACRYWLKRVGFPIDYYAWWYESEANAIAERETDEKP